MDELYLSLDEIKKIELSILKKYAKYCEENNLHYALTYGTLLGAVRHNGFIPWDDDVDVMMPREDYNQFIQLVDQKSIEGCELLRRSSSKYIYPFLKLCDVSTVAKMDDNTTEHGIWIDIFPVDLIPEDDGKARKVHKKIRFLKNMIIAYTTDFKSKTLKWKLIPKLIYKYIAKVVGTDKIVDRIELVSTKYNRSASNKCAIVSWQSSLGGSMNLEDIEETLYLEFEDSRFRCPHNYDEYLTSIYHDYMKIPPQSRQATHHLNAYYKK